MKRTYIVKGISLFLAVLLLTSSVFAIQPVPTNQYHHVPTISCAEIREDYRELVEANKSQMTAEHISQSSTSRVAASDEPEEFLRQNYNLMYQLSKGTPNMVTVKEGIDEDSVYHHIQYDKTTESYIMFSADEENYVSILIGEEEYKITLENDELIMRLNGKNPLVLCNHCHLFTSAAQESTEADFSNNIAKATSDWVVINTSIYETGAWVKVLGLVTITAGEMIYKVSHPILGAITIVSSIALTLGGDSFQNFEVHEIEYWRSDCVLYRRVEQDWYDIGSGTGRRTYVKSRNFTYWTDPPSGSGCMQYDYPGY